MRLDFEKFIDKEFPDAYVPQSNQHERRISCISRDCPKPKNHMFVNVKKCRFMCHRCGIAGDDKAFFCMYYGLPYAEVVKNYGALYGLEKDGLYYDAMEAIVSMITEKEASDLIAKVNAFTIDLPRCYEPISEDSFPKYLSTRNIPKKVVDEFFIGQCRAGFYKNRLIIPITTGHSLSFVAYSMFSKKVLERFKKLHKQYPHNKVYEKNKKKILNPKSSLSSLLLFNYDNVKRGCERLFVVEGIFDAIRLWLFGENAVAIFGISLSNFQRNLLLAKCPGEIIFMFDGDVWGDEKKLKIINKAVEKVSCYYSSKISTIRLRNGVDPDDVADKKTLDQLLQSRVLFGGSIFEEVSSRLSFTNVLTVLIGVIFFCEYGLFLDFFLFMAPYIMYSL